MKIKCVKHLKQAWSGGLALDQETVQRCSMMQFASELARSNLNPERTGGIDGLGYSRLQKWFSQQFFMICSICCAVSLWHAEPTSFMQPDLGDVYLKIFKVYYL